MRGFFIAILISLFFGPILQAKVVTTTTSQSSTGEGVGQSREEAISNAIVEALGKINGVSINSLKKTDIQVTSDSESSHFKDHYNAQIQKLTKGRVDSYEVLRVEKDADGNYVAEVSIVKNTTTKKYDIPGLSADSRRSIVVISHSSDKYASIGSQLQQKIITDLLESRKFNVLDRDAKGYYEMEKAVIKSGNANSDEIYKLGNVLGTDYMLIFSVKEIDGAEKRSNLTGKSSVVVEIVVDYRVLLFATRQIKFSNTLATKVNLKDASLATNEKAISGIAHKISSDILNAIYPLKIEQIENNEAIFAGKLQEGDTYECFSLGKSLKDSYTKESLGKVETKVASIEVVRTSPKLSYAKVTEGKIKKGDICRPLSSSSGSDAEGREANYKIDEGGGVNLGF